MRNLGSNTHSMWLGVFGLSVLSGCATMPRPAVLEDASSAIKSPESQELQSLRPKLYAEANDNLLKAEAAYIDGDELRTQQYAEIALQKIRSAENFVARDSAIAMAEGLRGRYDALVDRESSERRDVERMMALDARVDVLNAKLLEKAQSDSAVRAARKAMLDARTRQAEAIGVGAPQYAKSDYEEAVALLSSGVSALELGLLEESINSSAASSAKFAEAIGKAGVAKTAAGKPAADADIKAEADAAILQAQSAQAAAIGAGARSENPARYGEGEVLLSTAERRFDGTKYAAAKELAEKATRAFRASIASDVAPADSPVGVALAGGGGDASLAAKKSKNGAQKSSTADSLSRAQRMIQMAEDVRADAIARGMAEADVEMAHSGYLLETARRALKEGDDLRAEEKARESRQILRDALLGRFGAAIAGADRGTKQEGQLRGKADAALNTARAARLAQALKEGGADCKALKDGDNLLTQGEKKFQGGDYPGALENAIRATERIASCANVVKDDPIAKPQPPASADAKLKAATALSEARTAVAIAKADKSPKAVEGEALLETADNWYDRSEYALAEKFAKQATEAVKKVGGAVEVAPTKPVASATRETALAAMVKAQRARAEATGGHAAKLRKADQHLANAQSWFDKKAYPEAQAFAEDAYKTLQAKDPVAEKPTPGPIAKQDDCAVAGKRVEAQGTRLAALELDASKPMAKLKAEAESLVSAANRRILDGKCREALGMSRDAEPLVAAVERAVRGSSAAEPATPRSAVDRRSAEDAISEASLARREAEDKLTPAMQGTYARGESFLREAKDSLDREEYSESRASARAATAQFDAVRAGARSATGDETPRVNEKGEPIAAASQPKATVEQFTEQTIIRYQKSGSEPAAPGWEDPYRKVIRALKLRDRAAPLANSAEAQATFASGNDLLKRARTAWQEKQFRSAAGFADRASSEFLRLGAIESSVDVKTPGPDGKAPGPDGKAPGPDGKTPGSDTAEYRAADGAVREARVMLEVCDREKCSERGAKDFIEGKELLASAQTALTEGRLAYAKELAESSRKKLATALSVPRKDKPPPVDTADTKKEKDAATDALREADVQRKLCETAKCGEKDLEGWLRSESNLGAARAALADGDYARAESKAKEASQGLKSILDELKKVPPPPKGLTLPEGVTGVEIKDTRIVVTPAYDFQSGSSNLTAASLPSVSNLARVILHNKAKIANVDLVGFTDNRGNAAINKTLSKRRAQAVVDALVASGVPRALVRSDGRGADEPIADNDTADGRSANRRVEVRVVMQ